LGSVHLAISPMKIYLHLKITKVFRPIRPHDEI
jgi:hypothetical protein